MTFKETLPESCPPNTAATFEGKLMRLVGPDPLSPIDFHSRSAMGLPPIPGRECSCASCSMILPSITPDALADLFKFPNLRKKTALAYIEVTPSAGVGETKGTHVDFWMYAEFDPLENVAEVVEIEKYGK